MKNIHFFFHWKDPSFAPQWMKTDPHQSALLQNFRSLGTRREVYTFLERLEDMTSYPRNSKRKLFPNQILYPGKVRGDKKAPVGTPDLKQLKSLRSFSGSPWSLCSTTWGRGSRLRERMTGGPGTRRASQGERAKGILKVTVTRDPRMSESQAETGENSNICGQVQSGLHSHNHPSLEMNRRAQWKSEEPLLPQGDTKWGMTKSVPHVNGHAKVGPLVKTLLTADPIAQRKHEGPILLYLHIRPCVSRQFPERRAKGTFPPSVGRTHKTCKFGLYQMYWKKWNRLMELRGRYKGKVRAGLT